MEEETSAVNFVFIFEGEGENGSTGFQEVLAALACHACSIVFRESTGARRLNFTRANGSLSRRNRGAVTAWHIVRGQAAVA